MDADVLSHKRIQKRQVAVALCLTTLAVVDLFRFKHSLMANRVAISLNFRFATCLSVGLNIVVEGKAGWFFLCFHNAVI